MDPSTQSFNKPVTAGVPLPWLRTQFLWWTPASVDEVTHEKSPYVHLESLPAQKGTVLCQGIGDLAENDRFCHPITRSIPAHRDGGVPPTSSIRISSDSTLKGHTHICG